ncbi:retrovirus-related pol polyprotein from transposon TNT 1-94 [Tanacetum coccineum]
MESRFLRYIDTTPNGDALRKCILEGPYKLTTVTIPVVPATNDTPATAYEMWIAIERLQQGESLNIQDVKTNLFWKFGKFTSHDGESMESYYSRFYKMMNGLIRNNLTVATMQVNVNFLQQLQPEWLRFVTIVKQQHDLDTVSYHKLFDVLEQYQKEVKEIRAERITKNSDPLALIAKPITSPSESAFEEDSDPEQAQKDKDMQKNLALIAKYFKKLYKPTNNNLKTSSNSRNKNVDTSRRYKNDNQTGQFGNQRTVTVAKARETVGSQETKRVKDYTYHKEKMSLCKQAEKGVPLQAEQADWLEDTNEEIDKQELEAHYGFMEKIQEVLPPESNSTAEPLEQTDQNAEDERVALANLIANLKLDVDENKNIQKQLKKANTSLAHDLKECKSILAESSRTLGESNSIWDSCLITLQNKQTELETYKTLNDRTVDYDKLKHKELVIKLGKSILMIIFISIAATKCHDMEILIKTCLMPLAIKTQNDSFTFVHELKKKMHTDLKYVESLEKEIDKLEYNKVEFSNMYDILLQECVSNDVMCSYLHSLSDFEVHAELQCIYVHKVKECECLAQKFSKQTESVSKEVYTELLRSFAKLEKHSISLELALQQCKEQMKNDKVCKEMASNVFKKEREQYHEIQDSKAQLQDKNIAISDLKKLIEKCKGKSVETKTKKPKVVPISTRQPKSQANKSVSTPLKKTIASESIIHKSKSYYRMLYEKTSKAWKWWIEQQCTSGYKWVPKTKMKWVPKVRNENVDKRVSFAINNASRITNVVKLTNTLGSNLSSIPSSSNSLAECSTHPIHCIVRFGNDQFALILGYGDLVQEINTIKRVYYVKGVNHNLFSVGQFCDADFEMDVVIGLSKMKYVKDQLCSSCEVSKAKRSSFKIKVVPSSKGRLNLLHKDLCGPMRVARINGKKYVLFLNKTLHAFFKEEGTEHQNSTPRTPEQNGVVKRRNRTLVEVVRTMLSAFKLPLFFWAETIAIALISSKQIYHHLDT